MKQKSKNGLIRILQVVLLGVVVWQLIGVGRYYLDLHQSRSKYDTIQKEVADAMDTEGDATQSADDMLTPGRTITPQSAERVLDLLKQQNEDAVGYIKIDRAQIEYPVVQGVDNDEYLYQSFDGEYSIAGSVFMDWKNTSDFSDENTILYGHHMKDGSMFHNLSAWRRAEHEGEQIDIEIATESGPKTYRVYSIYNVPEEEPYRQISFSDNESFAHFVQKTWNDSETGFDADPTGAAGIITLSTCTPNQEEFRIAVHAYLISD